MHFPIVNPFFFVRDLDFEYILLYYNLLQTVFQLLHSAVIILDMIKWKWILLGLRFEIASVIFVIILVALI